MKIYPVIHIQDLQQCREQTQVVVDSGADGVFLIDHNNHTEDLIHECLLALKSEAPKLFVGINYLGGPPFKSYQTLDEGNLEVLPDALWVDDAVGNTYGSPYYLDDTQRYLEKLKEFRDQRGLLEVALFGGVSFKYTSTYSDDPEISASQASALDEYIDVVTTSGTGTGNPPPPAKIAAMSAVVSNGLAVASGLDAENIGDYQGLIDYVLISSSLETEKYSGIFDIEKVNRFMQQVKR